MNFKKSLAACALLALSATGAFAADQSVAFNGDLASFIATSPVLDGGDDVVSFTNLASGQYDFLLTLSGQYIKTMDRLLAGPAGFDHYLVKPAEPQVLLNLLKSVSSAP